LPKQDVAVGGVVVDDQHALSVQLLWNPVLIRRGDRGRDDGVDGEVERRPCALAALHPHGPAHEFA
jgi:hypothetical protein